MTEPAAGVWMPEGRRRCRAGLWLTAAFGFLALTAAAPACRAVPGAHRFPVEPFVKPERGTFFKFVETEGSASAWSWEARKAYRRADPGGARSASIPGMALDELARSYAIAYDDYQSALLLLKVVLEAHGGHLPAQQGKAIEAVVLFPDGQRESRGLSVALLLDYAIENMYRDELRRRPSTLRLDGRFHMSTQGTCGFVAGSVEVVTKGHFIEITRGRHLLAEGVAGRSRLFLLTNEQKYASMTAAKPHARIVVPDPTPELYEAVVADGGIHARGVVHRQCSFTLSRE